MFGIHTAADEKQVPLHHLGVVPPPPPAMPSSDMAPGLARPLLEPGAERGGDGDDGSGTRVELGEDDDGNGSRVELVGGSRSMIPAWRRLTNVVIVTVGFSLLFCSYSTLQAYVSSLLPGSLGFQSLAVVYLAFELCLVTSPFFCETLGDVGAMVLGSSCYVVYIASLITLSAAVILPASAVLGFGAALLWVGQGSALTRWSTDVTRGKFAGIFWAGLQLSAVVGPLTSYIVLSDVPDADKVTYLFGAFTAVAVVAVVTFCLPWAPCVRIVIPKDDEAGDGGVDGDNDGDAAMLDTSGVVKGAAAEDQNNKGGGKGKGGRKGKQKRSCRARLCEPVARGAQLCRTRNVALLLMPCAFTGVETGFSNGEFFKLVGLLPCDAFSGDKASCVNQSAGCVWNETAAAATCAKDVNIISLVFIAFGVGDVVGGYVLGASSDSCAKRRAAGACRKLIVSFGAALYAAALGLTFFMKQEALRGVAERPLFPSWVPAAQATSWLSFVVALLYGVADAAFQTQIYATLGILHPTEGRVTFMVFQIVQQLGSILSFTLPLALDLSASDWPLVIQAVLLLLAWAAYSFVHIPVAHAATE